MAVSLSIDGKKVIAEEGTNLIEAAKTVGIEIPTLCYLKELEVVSSCRMCLVELEEANGRKRLATACSTPVQEGLKVRTNTERLIEHRRGILRLYLDNHPNDCLTCQKSGECELQDLAYKYDVKFRDHDGERRTKKQAMFTDISSPYILRDESKCILCGRCVRTCAKVDRNVLTFADRGFYTHIAADADQTLEKSSCVSCNRCVAACPVGALLDRRSHNRIRNWQQEKKEVTCKRCPYGCKMEVLYHDGQAVSVRAKGAEGDKRPLCLLGRISTEFEYVEDNKTPYKKVEREDGNKFLPVSWLEALELDGIYDKLKKQEDE